jgi:hypothetical protein
VNDAWWLGLIIGIFEVGLGFWAAGSFGRSAALLIVFVAAIAAHAWHPPIIVLAFRMRKLSQAVREAADRVGVVPPPGGMAPA